MTRPDQIAEMVAQHEAAFGTLDILVNNAGIQHVSPIEEFPIDKWDAIIAINLRSEEHTSELQSLMRISYAVFCLKKKQPTIELPGVQRDYTNYQHKYSLMKAHR